MKLLLIGVALILLLASVSNATPLSVRTEPQKVMRLMRSIVRIENMLEDVIRERDAKSKALRDLNSCNKSCARIPMDDKSVKWEDSARGKCYKHCERLEPADFVAGC